MSAMSRRKGTVHEREVVDIIRSYGHSCARNLDQTRDGGGDIPFGDFLIECKRRATIAVYPWWDQAKAACKPSLEYKAGYLVGKEQPKPMLVIRADKRENLVVMRLEDFLELIPNPPGTEGRVSLKGTQG